MIHLTGREELGKKKKKREYGEQSGVRWNEERAGVVLLVDLLCVMSTVEFSMPGELNFISLPSTINSLAL